jgi:hypothetical protein
MGTAKGNRKRAVKAPAEPELATARLVLPAAKVRRLVSQIILAEGVAPFVRRMVDLRDDLLAGRVEAASRVAGRSSSRPSGQLISTIAHAARDGRVEEAEETAFYAASYAYRNSLDYFLGLFSYLDGFRRAHARRGHRESRAAAPGSRRR